MGDEHTNENDDRRRSTPPKPHKTKITCASCSGMGSKWNGLIMAPCAICGGKGYL